MNFGEVVYKLRKDAKLKQEYVAEQIGVKKNTISNYENNISKPCYEVLVKLCNLFKIDPNTLMQEDVNYTSSQISKQNEQILSSYYKLSESDRKIVDFILKIGEYNAKVSQLETKPTIIYKIPIYQQDVAAGVGQLGFDQKHTIEEFQESDMPNKISYGIKIKGSSMTTDDDDNIPDGSIALVTTEMNYDELPGEAVIVNISGVLVCKEYNIAEDGHLWLKSRNLNKSDEDKHIYNMDSVKIIGRVVKVIYHKL